tara:strand:- start:240 stop:731 length:492 start_codon:yes stop_codon:yes gene_type:complete
MPKAVRIKKTFNFKKFANKLDGIIVADLNTVGNHINKAIQDGIDSGKDIKGGSFKALAPITKELGGNKPLDRTGNMRKTKKTPATRSKKSFIIEMAGKSKKGAYYGAYHNTGFTQTNPKQWFHGAKVPKREWFGIPKSMFPGESAYEKAIAERSMRVRSAFKK